MAEWTSVTRQELYEQVWGEPLIQLAPRYSLTGAGLAKLCDANNIPRPERGYWQKLTHGKKLSRTPLPDSEQNLVIQVLGGSDSCPPPDREPTNDLERALLFERNPANRPVVRNSLRGLHPLVQRTKQESETYDALRPEERWTRQRHFRVAVYGGRKGLQRGWILADAIIRALEKRDFEVRVEFSDGGHYRTYAIIWGVKIQFSISELRKQPQAKQLYPWMNLCLDDAGCSGIRQNWNDTANQKLEELLSSFLETMIRLAWIRRQKIEKEAEELAKVDQEREWRAAAVEAYNSEGKRVEDLKDQVQNWQLAQDIRSYVQAAQRAGVDPDWARWALEQADRFDPLTEAPASVLDDPPARNWSDFDRGVSVSTWQTKRWSASPRR